MNDLGQALNNKVEEITASWVEKVHRDSEIESARKLAYEAVRNSLPEVLEQLAELLSESQPGSPQILEKRSFYHGTVRAQQGYDTSEIIREYRLLRQVILVKLEDDFLTGSTKEVLDSVRLIDDVFDQIITASIESYIEARLVELRQMQSQLTLTNQELTRLIQAHKENLSFMAHELKTPLTSIIGHSSSLLQKQRKKINNKDNTINLDQLERVLRNGRSLLQIINDTLEISRYNNGQIRLLPAPTDVRSLIDEIVEDGLRPLAEEKGLDLRVEIRQAPESVVSDGLRVQQLVTNLVTNAIRYTEEGSITVRCQQPTPNSWEISVSDTGIGISEDEKTQIFDPYVQSGTATTGASVGVGLGLAIVQRIVDLMGGNIDVASELGKGSTFTVTLPMLQYD